MTDLADVIAIYQGSDGARTTALYDELAQVGPLGFVAIDLFRAQKASERAKIYRGGGFKGRAYEKKGWALDNVCRALGLHGGSLVWGWGVDKRQPVHCHVLYVDLPTGQVSFHAERRGAGPDYPGEWDGKPGTSPERIIRWCAGLLAGADAEKQERPSSGADAPPSHSSIALMAFSAQIRPPGQSGPAGAPRSPARGEGK